MSDEPDLAPIDASLRRMFVVPDLAALCAKVDVAAAEGARVAAPPPRQGRSRWIAAAAIAVAATAVLVLARRDTEEVVVPPTIAPVARVDIEAREARGVLLAELYAQGPTLPRSDDDACLGTTPPPDACTGDTPQPRLAVGEVLEVLGECGAPGGPGCDRMPGTHLVHLRDTDGAEVLVCIESRHADPQPVIPEGSELTIFRRELGAFVLYEVTPLTGPRALDRFVLLK